MSVFKQKRDIYLKVDADGTASEMRYAEQRPAGKRWALAGKRVWDGVEHWSGWRNFRYTVEDHVITEFVRIPKVKLNVSTARVETGGEFSVRVDPIDVDPADDKTVASVFIDGVKYDLEIGDDMVLIEATEAGVYSVVLDDPDVRCVNASSQAVMVVDGDTE